MRTPKRRPNGTAATAGEKAPSILKLAIIRQFSQCIHVEKSLRFPDNLFFTN